ncbi:uncharacterized protein [Montipora foliosa]|uniref:uncharacterized protein isoform X2 n=1 Tax=Montipora foliosa TaxID=591990 RepID=UPI0035F14C67
MWNQCTDLLVPDYHPCNEVSCPNYGVCKAISATNHSCVYTPCATNESEPLCDNNGFTHQSICQNKCKVCQDKEEPGIKHYGGCKLCRTGLRIKICQTIFFPNNTNSHSPMTKPRLQEHNAFCQQINTFNCSVCMKELNNLVAGRDPDGYDPVDVSILELQNTYAVVLRRLESPIKVLFMTAK